MWFLIKKYLEDTRT